MNLHAQQLYRDNFGADCVIAGDICDYSADMVPKHDVLTAGFPCQSFSRAGTREALDCENGNLFFELLRIIRCSKPAVILLENVANLLLIDQGRTWHIIQQALRTSILYIYNIYIYVCVMRWDSINGYCLCFVVDDAGYHITYRLLNSRMLVPQQRRRLFIIGFRDFIAFQRFRWPRIPVFERCIRSILDDEDVAENDIAATTASSEVPVAKKRKVEPTKRNGRGHEFLTATQWQKIVRHPDNDEGKARLANLDGGAKTIMSNYSKGWARFSEFVSVAGHNEPR